MSIRMLPRFDPSLDHQPFSLYKDVYEPSEDTFLMCDALKSDYTSIEELVKTHKTLTVLEMGPGSGYCISYLKKMLNYIMSERNKLQNNQLPELQYDYEKKTGNDIEYVARNDEENITRKESNLQSTHQSSQTPSENSNDNSSKFIPYKTYCIDINQKALDATRDTFLHNDISYGSNDTFIHGSLFDKLSNQSNAPMFDIILFNPPYVQSEDCEVEIENSIYSAWAGGNRGRIIIDTFLHELVHFLKGYCYLLLEQVNDIEQVQKLIQSLGMQSKCIIQRRIAGEYLYVFKITRLQNNDE